MQLSLWQLACIVCLLLLTVSASHHPSSDISGQLSCILTAASGYSPEGLCAPHCSSITSLCNILYAGFRLSSATSSTARLAGGSSCSLAHVPKRSLM
jgi:hypothetical protein